MASRSLEGRLLIAAPSLKDPNFARTVVLVLAHHDEGALGVVLNRPSELEVSQPLAQWAELAVPPSVVFVGGPVAPAGAICLAEVDHEVASTDTWKPLNGVLGTLDLAADPASVGPTVRRVRGFSGHAGWGTAQLEGEVAVGGWMIADARPDDPFSARPADLWHQVLRRQGGPLAMLASYPEDPSLN
ncbi:MAG: YqgE/AlgH family protein [Acidimicrobiales bacterium]|nr:MAG: YqgE/AlgH family protein [Acidimicrobiales bacterium]